MRVFISTGEVSGDKNASYLVRKLKGFNWRFYALGGENLRDEGVEIVENPESISVVGFQEAILRLNEINKVKRKVLKYALNSDLIIGVDFPGFNLPLLKYLKQKGKRVVYYISPQVWAWGKWRVKDLRLFDAVLCILPFEEGFLKSYGVNAFFVGHPAVKDSEKGNGIDLKHPIIGFLPGSRKDEVRRLLPRMLKIAEFVKKLLPDANFLFSIPFDYNFNLSDVHYVIGRGRDVIRISDVVVLSSGTATLEAAVEGKPAVVLYMVSELTYWIGRAILKIPYISLPNIVLKREVYPEFVQHIKPEGVAEKVLEMYERREGFSALSKEISELLKGKYDEAEVLKDILRL